MKDSRPLHPTRRRFLRNTAVGALGLSLPQFLELESRAEPTSARRRPKSLIFLYLYGGPSQIDIWDMKPDASVEYRGEFDPIQTSVPGTIMCEHLPRMARLAQHYSIIRTLHHVNRNHQPAGSWLLTGVNPRTDNAAQLRPSPDDPPAIGSLATRLAPPRPSGVPPFIMMPARLRDQGSAFLGQSGGWMGSDADPLHITQDPNSPVFRVEGFDRRPQISRERLTARRDLLQELDRNSSTRQPGAQAMTQFQERAWDLILGGRGRSAFNLDAEPSRIRDRYGRNMFGQSCLLARRLIEAGARVVTVFDCKPTGAHEWDTHRGNFTTLRNELLPRLDLAYSALMEDLIARGMLEDTVVYLGGEFGRTPRVGQAGFSGAGASSDGRDHYPNCFCGILAGGHSRPGIIHGESDRHAAFPTRDGMTPEDLTATLFTAMGLDPEGIVYTRDNRPMIATHGRPAMGLIQ